MTNNTMYDFAAKQSTGVLFRSIDTLEGKGESATPEERMAMTAMYEVIEDRHNLHDELDNIFSDEDFAGTYGYALTVAMLNTGHSIGQTF